VRFIKITWKQITSSHLHLLVFDISRRLLGEVLYKDAVEYLVGEVGLVADDAELDLLLLLLHLVLRDKQNLGDVGQRLVDGHLSEVLLLDLISRELLASAACTAVVLVALA